MQSLQYFSPSIFYALTWPDLKKNLKELEIFKHELIEGRGFRGGSNEQMRRMWLGRKIVVAGLPPLQNYRATPITKLCFNSNEYCDSMCPAKPLKIISNP